MRIMAVHTGLFGIGNMAVFEKAFFSNAGMAFSANRVYIADQGERIISGFGRMAEIALAAFEGGMLVLHQEFGQRGGMWIMAGGAVGIQYFISLMSGPQLLVLIMTFET